MIKEAIEKLESMVQPVLTQVGGATFMVTAKGTVHEIDNGDHHPDTIVLNSLEALVQLVKTEATNIEDLLYIDIPSFSRVTCFGRFQSYEDRHFRQTYYEAIATDVPKWESKLSLGFEEAMITLRTRFLKTADADYTLRLLSEVTTGGKVTYNDNGVATSVVTQKGIALQGNETIRPIVSLCPYRTFQEVAQPASDFLIRINERGINFIEADGGMWKLQARKNIQSFLQGELEGEIKAGKVIVVL